MTSEYQKKCNDAYDALTVEQRKEIMRQVWEGGEDNTIGKIRGRLGLSLEAVCEVITRNIETAEYHSLKPVEEVT